MWMKTPVACSNTRPTSSLAKTCPFSCRLPTTSSTTRTCKTICARVSSVSSDRYVGVFFWVKTDLIEKISSETFPQYRLVEGRKKSGVTFPLILQVFHERQDGKETFVASLQPTTAMPSNILVSVDGTILKVENADNLGYQEDALLGHNISILVPSPWKEKVLHFPKRCPFFSSQPGLPFPSLTARPFHAALSQDQRV